MTEKKKQSEIVEILRNQASSLLEKSVTLGFDGFIDSVMKVIRHKDPGGTRSYFGSTQAFGEYIAEKGQKNISIELEEHTTKLGGNMPIMANALSNLGVGVSCIGPLGYPDIHPVFQPMAQQCGLYTFGDPGISRILEFASGKIMFAEMEALNRITWETIVDRIGIDTFRKLFTGRDLIALLNWSEFDNSSDIWKGIIRDVLPGTTSGKRPTGFFDLSDCSRRTDASIQEAVKLIQGFSVYWDIVLSLNLNEATILHATLTERSDAPDAETMCQDIFEALRIDTVVIHYAGQAIARDQQGLHQRKSFFLQNPALSTGSGDNFNAGFCMGRLMGCETGESLVLGHATAHLYMRSTESPTIAQLVTFLTENS
jgi:sugar/nucleoside kinase (ribokinase family)